MRETLYAIITQAVKDISNNGYNNSRMIFWTGKIREAIAQSSKFRTIKFPTILKNQFENIVKVNNLKKMHQDVPAYRLEQIKPSLRSELDKRILASADLIKLNRSAAVEKTIQRFSGWATSIPQTGSLVVDKNDTKDSAYPKIE